MPRVVLALALLSLGALAVDARAAPPPRSGPEAWLDRLKTNPLGSLYLKLRPRWEHAQIDGLRDGNALTLRTVLGVGSRSWKGLSFLVEGESVVTADRSWYWDGRRSPNGRSFIPDPPDLDLNQGYLAYERPEWTTRARVGRQRLLFADERFIGNVGWRQNEQTFDAVELATGLGRKDVQLRYAYLHQVLRVFGDGGDGPTGDFDSTSHAIHLRYQALPELRVAAFAYLLDFPNSDADSSNSFGFRATGTRELDDTWALGYAASYAYQTDAANNPVDYDAHYAWLEGRVDHAALGAVAVGWELLGSDDGRARFGTPLGTLHKFNGYADVFLDNGGPDGLRDLFASLRPALPWLLRGEVAFHWFHADQGGDRLGWEIDAVLSRPLNRHVTVLAKVAWFDARSGGPRPDVLRTWLQLSLSF